MKRYTQLHKLSMSIFELFKYEYFYWNNVLPPLKGQMDAQNVKKFDREMTQMREESNNTSLIAWFL